MSQPSHRNIAVFRHAPLSTQAPAASGTTTSLFQEIKDLGPVAGSPGKRRVVFMQNGVCFEGSITPMELPKLIDTDLPLPGSIAVLKPLLERPPADCDAEGMLVREALFMALTEDLPRKYGAGKQVTAIMLWDCVKDKLIDQALGRSAASGNSPEYILHLWRASFIIAFNQAHTLLVIPPEAEAKATAESDAESH